jgi:hypothetical protein
MVEQKAANDVYIKDVEKKNDDLLQEKLKLNDVLTQANDHNLELKETLDAKIETVLALEQKNELISLELSALKEGYEIKKEEVQGWRESSEKLSIENTMLAAKAQSMDLVTQNPIPIFNTAAYTQVEGTALIENSTQTITNHIHKCIETNSFSTRHMATQTEISADGIQMSTQTLPSIEAKSTQSTIQQSPVQTTYCSSNAGIQTESPEFTDLRALDLSAMDPVTNWSFHPNYDVEMMYESVANVTNLVEKNEKDNVLIY